jgi:predicted DNA-binding protein (UPF0251 family)
VLLTAAQVAEKLGISARTVQRRAAAGELKVVQQLPGPTGALLFDSDDLNGAEETPPRPARTPRGGVQPTTMKGT